MIHLSFDTTVILLQGTSESIESTVSIHCRLRRYACIPYYTHCVVGFFFQYTYNIQYSTQNPCMHTRTKSITKSYINTQQQHTCKPSSLRSLYSCHISGKKVGSPLDGGVPTDRHDTTRQRLGRFSLL